MEFVLTESLIVREVERYRDEWEQEYDWWWGTTDRYLNAPNGYDVNIFRDAEGEPFKAVAYELEYDNTGYSIATDKIIMSFLVPPREEYKEENMKDIKEFKIDKKSIEELKAEALLRVLDLDMTCVIESNATRAELPSVDEDFTIVITTGVQRNLFSVQVYEGLDTQKGTRIEWMSLEIHMEKGIIKSRGMKILSLVEAMKYVTDNPGEVMVDASKPIERTVHYNVKDKFITFSDGATMRNTDPTIKTWIYKPKKARSATLLALHDASYFNGKLVSVHGKQDMLVNIGDHLITDCGEEFLVAVYRVNKECI